MCIRDRYDLEKRYGYKFISDNEGELYETNFKIKDDTLYFRRFDSDIWIQDEIVYYKNDTLILRNSAQHLLNFYVRMKPDKNINYKIQRITSYHSAWLGTCISYTANIGLDGNVNLLSLIHI